MDRMGMFPDEQLIAFATDTSGRIVGWSTGAERLLGYRAHEVRGRICSEVLQGRDVLGNKHCDPRYPLHNFSKPQPPHHDLLLDVTSADGRTIRADIGVFSLREVTAPTMMILHVVRAAIPIHQEQESAA